MLTINTLDGGDAVTIDFTAAISGIGSLSVYGNEFTDGGLNADDWAADFFYPRQTSAAVATVAAFGQDGDDAFVHAAWPGSLDGLLGPALAFDGGPGFDAIHLQDINAAAADVVTLTDTTLTGALGNVAAVFTYTNSETFLFEATGGDDTLNVLATNAGTTYLLSGDGGGDTFNLGNAGSLDAILGPLTITPDFNGVGGADTINLDDSATGGLAGTGVIDNPGSSLQFTTVFGEQFQAPTTRLSGFAPADIFYFHGDYDGGTFAGNANALEVLDVTLSSGADTVLVNATTAHVSTTIRDADAAVPGPADDAAFTIRADALQAGAANEFYGLAGNDTFQLNFAGDQSVSTAAGTTFLIDGGAPANDTNNRDVVNVNTAGDWGSQRAVGIRFVNPASGDVEVSGLGTAGAIALNGVETLRYIGSPWNDDQVTVTGTPADDLLTVAPFSDNAALVFRGGNPWDGPADGDFYAAIPGVAGGSAGPDLVLAGLSGWSGGRGLTVSSGSAMPNADQVFVYGHSQADVADPATTIDPFGFGVGVIIPSAGTLGLPTANDTVFFNDTEVNINSLRRSRRGARGSGHRQLRPVRSAASGPGRERRLRGRRHRPGRDLCGLVVPNPDPSQRRRPDGGARRSPGAAEPRQPERLGRQGRAGAGRRVVDGSVLRHHVAAVPLDVDRTVVPDARTGQPRGQPVGRQQRSRPRPDRHLRRHRPGYRLDVHPAGGSRGDLVPRAGTAGHGGSAVRDRPGRRQRVLPDAERQPADWVPERGVPERPRLGRPVCRGCR